jgi:hypothetical protein
MAGSAIDYLNLTRICEFTRALHQLHQTGGDEVIDREFNAVCRVIWGYGLDDFTDDDLSPNDHAWLARIRFCCPPWLRPQGLRPRRLGERLVGVYVDDLGRGAGGADTGEPSCRVAQVR